MADEAIIGHRTVLNFFEQSLANGRLAHAYLFVGAAGLGKKKVAYWFINKIIGEGAPSCFQIKIIERAVNAKTGKKNKDISLDQVQEIGDFLSHSSLTGKIKAVIIEGVESLNQHAANALLKVLEEPRPDCFLILLAENSEEVLPTIVSRCQVLRFNSVATKEITEALIALGATSEAAASIGRLAFGLPGRAIEFYQEPKKLSAYKNHCQDFIKILSGPLEESWQVLEPYFKNKKADHIESREILTNVLANWAVVCRDLLLSEADATQLLANSPIDLKLPRRSALKLDLALEKILASLEWLNQNIHPKLVLENLILDIKYAQ